tara:strand:+ start:1078 stop:1641 length:564 start_codon:yes stop_codon:yes gene_type:complete
VSSGPFKVLDQEHDQIRIMLDLLRVLVVQVEERPIMRWLSPARSAVDWLETYNISHHRKEEKVLELLQEKGLANGELARFWKDHEQGELVFEHLGKALEALRLGKSASRPKVKRLFEVLLAKYGEHMEGEEEILFPAARMALTKEDRERLTSKFAEVEREMFRLSSELRLKAVAKAIKGGFPPAEEA